jgi:NAD(P)-dependent dehydrogenase (short-subunit alcohol dehydrogenase family)
MILDSHFEGRNGIVTGAASGIGRATALLLSSLGARLTVADISEKQLHKVAHEAETTSKNKTLAITTNVGIEDEVNNLVRISLDSFGSIDFVVNCAGILKRTKFLDLDPEEWDNVMGVNLRGTYLCCRSVIPIMINQGGGTIVNVASLAGRTISGLGGVHYCASKHGVVGLSRHLAYEMGPYNIRVNAFCPGGTLTPMTLNNMNPSEQEQVCQKTPLRRWATPEEQAKVIAFLLSDESSYITGAAIDSNGGSLMA